MDRCMGKASHDSRWKTMKLKYSIKSTSLKHGNASLELNPETLCKIQDRERARAYTLSVEQILQPQFSHTLHASKRPRLSTFFEGEKRTLKYLENNSQDYLRLKTEKLEERSKMRRRSWFGSQEKRDLTPAKPFEHPVLTLYKATTKDVLKSTKTKRQFGKPFDWFVSPSELEDL